MVHIWRSGNSAFSLHLAQLWLKRRIHSAHDLSTQAPHATHCSMPSSINMCIGAGIFCINSRFLPTSVRRNLELRLKTPILTCTVRSSLKYPSSWCTKHDIDFFNVLNHMNSMIEWSFTSHYVCRSVYQLHEMCGITSTWRIPITASCRRSSTGWNTVL